MQFTNSHLFLILSIAAYVGSLFLPGFYVGEGHGIGPGVFILFSGFFTVASGGFPWLANPLLFLTWALSATQPRWSVISGIATLGAMTSLIFIGKAPYSSEGTPSAISSFGAGYWFWVLSGALAIVSPATNLGKEKKR